MSAGNYELTIEQGATFNQIITWQDPAGAAIDITSFTAKLQVRDTKGSLLLDLSTTPNANGSKLTLGGSNGQITILITATDTAAMTFTTARYDLKLTAPNGVATRLIKGAVSLDKQVTV